MTFHPFSDHALLINFPQRIDSQINNQVLAFNNAILSAKIKGIQYTIPAYCSLTVGYDPQQVKYDALVAILKEINIDDSVKTESRLIEIPVSYASADALDMEDVCQQTGLTREEIIELHTAQTYRVFMLGFLPGFPYLGTLDERLKVTRKQNPRLRVPKNAVGLAGLQTGIYPSVAPGGWQIIGRAMLDVFNKKADDPFLLRAGDRVKFVPRNTGFQPVEKSENKIYAAKNIHSQVRNLRSTCSVRQPGLYTTIQDTGRSGWQSFGVPVGGAMDKAALRTANQLVGHSPDAPVLEITWSGLEIQFHRTTQIALTGADLTARVNGFKISRYRTQTVRKNDVLTFGAARTGCRAYLAIRGKWQLQNWLDSASAASTNGDILTPASILRKGDVLQIESLPPIPPQIADVPKLPTALLPIRVLPSIEFKHFAQCTVEHFFNRNHTISRDSNRMGYRLETQLVDFSPQQELISSGVVPGTIQITNSGQPIILMRDAQTTGGYYRFLNVIEEDLDLLAQAKPSDKIIFLLI